MATTNPFTSAQAPLAMQMIAPDLAVQQSQLMRQQQLAEMLRKQSMTPDGGTEMVSGWAVKKSPLEGAVKLAQALAGGYIQNSADEKQADLAKALQDKYASAFDKMSGAPPTSTTPSAPSEVPASGQGPAAGPSDASPQPQPPTVNTGGAPASVPTTAAPNDPIERIRAQARAAYMMGNTDLANKLLENISTLTTEQRNMLAMGQDPLEIGKYATAEAHKKSILELQPGTTSIDLSNGKERFVPKVGEGITLNNGQASAIPGYAQANASIAGANAGAVSGANAANEMITVNTPNGPVMMTRQQAVQQASGGGGNTAQGVPDGLDVSKLSPEQQQYFARKDPQAFSNGVASFQNTMTQGAQSQQPKPPQGIQLQDEGSSAFNKEINQKGAQTLLDSRDKARAANDELTSIYESKNAIKQGVYQGFGADFKTDATKIAQGFGIPIDGAKAANTDYLRSTLGKGMLDNAKKLGVNPTDADAKRLDTIIGTIGKDPQAMGKLLDWREEQANKVIEQHNRDIDSASQNGTKFPFDLRVNRNPNTYEQPAGSSSSKVRNYNATTGRIE